MLNITTCERQPSPSATEGSCPSEGLWVLRGKRAQELAAHPPGSRSFLWTWQPVAGISRCYSLSSQASLALAGHLLSLALFQLFSLVSSLWIFARCWEGKNEKRGKGEPPKSEGGV